MKQQSQSNELTGSLIASESVVDTSNLLAPKTEDITPPSIDFMYNWIRKHSGRVKFD